MAGPLTPRLTHIALPASDIDRSIAWYERFTPLRLLQRRDVPGDDSCWLAAPEATDRPFVLVLVSYPAFQENPRPTLAPFAHIGIELPTRDAVDAMAALAMEHGCLKWEARDIPAPVGYVCAATDPDGNIVEYSHNQGVFDAVRERWGDAAGS
jgi:catechol 2,3-dioxygenase-like lactoylglutathione lyase family enzyme